jgi:prepilin-type N-terminal cleavage/methylation domain-containing protein
VSGFTLIELLVVISIISLLIAILLPSLASARKRARQIQCAAQLRQIGMGHLQYAMDHKGWFPLTHWTTQAGLGDDGNIDPIQWYGGNDKILVCPDVEWMGPAAPHGYSPGSYSASISGIKFRWTAYRFTAARGTNTSSYTFYGLHRGSGTPNRNDNSISPIIPSLEMAGQTITDPLNGWKHYLHAPSQMPLAFDGRHPTTDNWYPYTSSLNAYFTRNHGSLGGVNVVFLDNHIQWGDQDRDPRRVSLYATGWIKW